MKRILLCAAFVLLISSQSFAYDDLITGASPHVTPMNRGLVTLGASLVYLNAGDSFDPDGDKQPLDDTETDLRIPFFLVYRMTERFQPFALFPVVSKKTEGESESGLGDIWLGAKYAVISEGMLTLRGAVNIANGDDAKGLGASGGFGIDIAALGERWLIEESLAARGQLGLRSGSCTIVGMYAVIMAGGGGTRLWPLSRSRRPKPFLPLLDGGRCLLEATVSRLSPIMGADDIYVVSEARHAALVRELLPAVPAANIIGEPMGRNTAAAVALMAHVVERPDDDVMLVLPADQAILDEDGYRAALLGAAERARSGDMVTLGVEPTEPSTGYGYVIATGEPTVEAGCDTYRVERFEEKPTPARARELIASRAAYWNAGIFAWRRATVLAGLARYAPDISRAIREWLADNGRDATEGWPGEAMSGLYAGLRATSIDYALLEPASLEGQVAVVPAAVGWSDLGSWSALRDHRGRQGTPVISAEPPARVIDVDGRNVLVHAAGGRLVAIVGLDDVVVVDTPDALLVSSAEAAQDVKKVVDRLKEEGRSDLL